MEFQWGRIAERRPNLLVEPAHVGLAHRLGREAVQFDCLVIEPEISRQIAFIPALTRLFNTARDRIHCFLLSRSLNSSFCPFQFLQASRFAKAYAVGKVDLPEASRIDRFLNPEVFAECAARRRCPA